MIDSKTGAGRVKNEFELKNEFGISCDRKSVKKKLKDTAGSLKGLPLTKSGTFKINNDSNKL